MSTPNSIFFSTSGKKRVVTIIGSVWRFGEWCDLWANTKRFRVQNVQNVRSRCHGIGRIYGRIPNVQNVLNVRSKFFEKNAFYVLTSEKYGVIYPAGKNNKKKYNHYVCYIRTDDSDTN